MRKNIQTKGRGEFYIQSKGLWIQVTSETHVLGKRGEHSLWAARLSQLGCPHKAGLSNMLGLSSHTFLISC